MSISNNLQKLHDLYLKGIVKSFSYVKYLNGVVRYNVMCGSQNSSLKENMIGSFIDILKPEESQPNEIFEKIGRLVESGRTPVVVFAPIDRLIILDNERFGFDSTREMFEFIKSIEEVENE